MIINKLWGGRFSETTDQRVEMFTASIMFDQQLVIEDILGSLAHVKMLEKTQILPSNETVLIINGLKKIAQKIAAGKVQFNIADEDIHMNMERFLMEEIGVVAGKLHTARSRNDQVTLDLHLYLRSHLLQIITKTIQLHHALSIQAQRHDDVIMPGYTHLQRAQPILFSHHLLAYCAMLQRDLSRLQDSWSRLNQSPLGAGALAGVGFPIDRHYVAELLGFENVYNNSMDAVSDRDFVVEFIANAALLMTHLSRLSEELIFWSSQEFNFIELDEAYCTGSSIMPQKKNPDIPELVRGKTGRVYGALFNILTVLKALPLAYNKDLQEDKEPLFDVVKTLHNVLDIYPALITSMKVNKEKMLQATEAGFMSATDLADYLTKKGLTFREAHAVSGKIVQYCLQANKMINEIPLLQLQKFSPLMAPDVYDVITSATIINARNSYGGTAQEQVLLQLKQNAAKIGEIKQWLTEKEEILQKIAENLL